MQSGLQMEGLSLSMVIPTLLTNLVKELVYNYYGLSNSITLTSNPPELVQPGPDVSEEADQRLALHILRQQNLVPEHIETRNLFTPIQPGISQGQLHMWVDIFNKHKTVPLPIDVSPRKPEKYVFRIVVWNTVDVEVSEATGEAMSDIYIKG